MCPTLYIFSIPDLGPTVPNGVGKILKLVFVAFVKTVTENTAKIEHKMGIFDDFDALQMLFFDEQMSTNWFFFQFQQKT